MRRNLLAKALALCAVVATGCSGSGKGSGSSAYTGSSNPVLFDVAVVKPMGGYITSDDGKINCGSIGSTDPTTVQLKCDDIGLTNPVTLTATAGSGYVFTSWAGDCSGTAATCTLKNPSVVGATTAPILRAVAVFTSLTPRTGPAPASAALSRVYGYVKDGAGTAAPGIKITIGQDVKNANGVVTTPAPNATTGSNGSFVIDVAAGTYPVTFVDTSSTDPAKQLYTVPTGVSLTVPAASDPSCPKASDMDPSVGVAGCLYRYDVLSGVTRTAYVPPAAPTLTVGATLPALGGANKLAGFGQGVGLSCSASVDAVLAWSISAGPVDISAQLPAPSTTATTALTAVTASITTPSVLDVIAATRNATGSNAANCPNGPGAGKPGSPAVGATGGNKIGCGVSNFLSENRPGFLAINRQQATEMGYTFVCTATVGTGSSAKAYTKSVTVPLVELVNLNVGNTLENLWNRANGAAGTTPVANGYACSLPEPAGTVCDRFGNAITFRATHFVPKAPNGAIVIVDDYENRAEGYSWVWRTTSQTVSTKTCNLDGTTLAAAVTDHNACLVNAPLTCDSSPSTSLDASCLTCTGCSAPAAFPAIQGQGTAHPWFIANGSNGMLVNANAVADDKSFKAGPTGIPVSFQKSYGGYGNNCVSCHDPKWGDAAKGLLPNGDLKAANGKELGPNKLVTEWKASKHARIVTDGMSGSHYSTSCLPCHSLGYANVNSPGPAKSADVSQLMAGGTFSWATPDGANTSFTTPKTSFPEWTFFPSPYTNFAAFDPQIQARMNVQCESCHGPGSAGGANAANCNAADADAGLCSGNGGTMHSASESSKVCGQCHDGGHHGIYSQWNASGHASLDAMNIAVSESVDGNVAATQTKGFGACYACHSAQQFVNYAANLVVGSPLAPPPVPTLEGQLGVALDYKTASPVTCQSCHEPHSLELRLEPQDSLKLGDPTKSLCSYVNPLFGMTCDTSNMAASLTNIALDRTSGAGQLCSTCHNSRGVNGLQQNGTTPTTVFSQPHHGTQTDVYMGVNMFWFAGVPASVTTTNVHRSSFFQDSCVDCHVKLVPAGYPTVANHTFDPNPSCFACHGTGTLPTGENAKGIEVKARTANQMAAIQSALATNLMTFINANAAALTTVNDGDPAKPVYAFAGHTVTGIEIAMAGLYTKPGFAIYVDGSSNPTLLTNVDSFQIGTPALPLVKVGGSNEWLFKVLWNYMLVAQDRSGGIHNMYVVNDLLNQTLAQASAAISTTP